MFNDSKEGQTHYQNDGCGQKEHNPIEEPSDAWRVGYKRGYAEGRYEEREDIIKHLEAWAISVKMPEVIQVIRRTINLVEPKSNKSLTNDSR